MTGSTRWIRDLGPADIMQIDAALTAVEQRHLAWHEIRPSHFPLPGLVELLADIREELENGCGMVKLRGMPVHRYSEDQLRKLYYGIGCNLGTPVFQNRRGEQMRLIRDEGGDVGKRYGQIERIRMADGKPFLSSYARSSAVPTSPRYYLSPIIEAAMVRKPKLRTISTACQSLAYGTGVSPAISPLLISKRRKRLPACRS